MATRLSITVLLFALLSACANPRVVRLDTGQGPSVEYRPPSSLKWVEVDAEAFEEALTQWVLQTPLTLRPPQQSWLVRASLPSGDTEARKRELMRKSFGGLCEAAQVGRDCISPLDNMLGWMGEWDKLGVALGLSLDPLKESIARAVEDTLAPQLFYTVIATGLISWVALAANPEPVFTKAAAIVSAILLIYLGVEIFLEVVEASRELKAATDQATTWWALDRAGQRFAQRLGPEIARVFVLAVTVMVSHGMTGGVALLASRLSMLPRFGEAAVAGAAQVGIRLANVWQVREVAVVGDAVVISLPATAIAAVAPGTSGPRSWGSYSGFKYAQGSAGPGKQWHHIVEQTDGNIQRFGSRSLHNTENVVAIDEEIHRKISAYYSSKDPRIAGTQTVRQWLSGQSFQAQRDFGLQVLRSYGVIP